MNKTNPVALRDTEVAQGLTPQALLERAVTGHASIEVVQKVVELVERVEARNARMAYDAAIAAAKAEFSPIIKTREASFGAGRTTYKYDDLADIARMVDPILARHGLNYRWKFAPADGDKIVVTCIVSHCGGHNEETTLPPAPADVSGSKNPVQAIGSTLTYLQRYSLRSALGLSAARDDDANYTNGIGSEPITEAQLHRVKTLIDETRSDPIRLCRYFKVDALAELTQTQLPNVIAALETKRGQRSEE